MKLRKICTLLLAVMFCMAVAAGCSDTSSSDEATSNADATDSDAASGEGTTSWDGSAEGGRIYWLNFKPESDSALQSVAAMYKEQTGQEVKIVTAASGTYEQTLSSEMDKTDAPTIYNIGTAEDVLHWADYAADLAGSPLAEQLTTDEYNMKTDDGKVVSIGHCYETFGIIVNPTLLEQAGYKVEDINNFDTLKTAAEDIHARAGELGFDAFTSNDMDPSSSWRYTGHMANIAYFYEQKDDPWTETPPTITGAYLENFKNLYDLAINNSTVLPTELATGGHDAEAEFRDGKAVFFVQGSWEWPQVSEMVPEAVMIPYYCGVEGEENAGLNSGTGNCWAINSKVSEADQQASMDFLVWCVTNKDAVAVLTESYGVMPFKEAPESTNGFLADAQAYEKDGRYNMNWAFTFQPNVEQYRDALVSALNQYDAQQNDSTWDTVKTAFVEGWAQQYAASNAS